jgi:eukaryotic-like serine/threonine-protein kinase
MFVWVDRNGGEQPFYEIPGFYMNPRLSRDGKRLLFASTDSGNFDVWLMELARRTLIRLTSEKSAEYYPTWGFDEKHITYSSNRYGPQNLFNLSVDGRGSEVRLTSVPDRQFPEQWTRDGSTLAFIQFGSDTNSDIWLLNRAAGTPVPFLRTSFVEMYPSFSPDGRWLVYCSNESGAQEVYVASLEPAGGKWKVSTEGGTEPLWAQSGREIYYRHGDAMITAVVRTEPAFAVDRVRTLFRGGYARNQSRTYDVTADGQRFVMLKEIDDQSRPTALNLVSNWLEQFKQKGQFRRQ